VKQEIDEELRIRIEARTAENIAAGMLPEESAREARKLFCNMQSVREECHCVRGASFAFRMLRTNPGFTVVGVLALASAFLSFNGHAAEVPAALKAKHIALVIAPGDFRDEEYLEPKAFFEGGGAKVVTVSTTTARVSGAGGAEAQPTLLLKDTKAEEFDAVVFVGGPGARGYYNHPDALRLVRETFASGKVIAAICVAPNILINAGILKDRRATAWAFEVPAVGVIQTNQAVVRDGTIVTANGPEAATDFAKAIGDALIESAGAHGDRVSPGVTPSAALRDAEPDRNRPPIIPAWAFGHWVWEDVVHTRDAVEYLVGGYRAYGIPVGAVIFDSPWCTTYNDFIWNPEGYPRAQDMIDDLHARGIKVVVFYTGAINRESNDTRKQKCDSYDYVVAHNFTINGNRESKWWKGPAVHLDFTKPEAVAWWQTQVAALHTMGVDGAKIDAAHAKFGATVETSRGPMPNREFGYHYFKQAFDYHTARNPEFVAMTYAWSGFGLVGWPATSHVNWVGDFRGDWQGMKDQLKAIYQSAQAGFSGLACEIGGYWRPPSTKEQFLRYAQMSCFMPIMVNGGQFGSLGHHLPWRHDDETVALYRDLVLLHYDLAPYLFSSGVDAHRDGGSIVRDSSTDTESHRLGPWLFVKAITSADATVRVTLPAGGDWFDFWTDARHAAGSVVERVYPRDQYPVFVSAGAILPVAGRSRFFGGTNAALPAATTFVIYPGGVSSYVFHQPTGAGTAYRDVRIAVDAAAGTIRVQADAEDTFRLLVKTTRAPAGVRDADAWSYDSANRFLRIEKRGRNLEVRINGLASAGSEPAAAPRSE
jgi:putative intracellular protease/amidase